MNTDRQFSFLRGCTFRFEDGPLIIESWFSLFTGLEKVSVNGELIFQQRNLSADSSVTFDINGNCYHSTLSIISFLKGPFVCSLYKNGKLYKQQKLVFGDPNYKVPWYLKYWFVVLFGLILGLLSTYFKFPIWIALVLVTILGTFKRINAPKKRPSIEEVEIGHV